MFRHLDTLGVEHQSAGDHILECHTVEDHRGDGMQGIEPSTCLINTLVDKVAGEGQMLVDSHFILKRIVYLCIRHRTRVEPYVDQVELTMQRLSALTYQHDIIHIRTVEIDLIVVLL